MEELGVYDNEMDTTDPRWTTPLGVEVYAYLIRRKMAEWVIFLYSNNIYLRNVDVRHGVEENWRLSELAIVESPPAVIREV